MTLILYLQDHILTLCWTVPLGCLRCVKYSMLNVLLFQTLYISNCTIIPLIFHIRNQSATYVSFINPSNVLLLIKFTLNISSIHPLLSIFTATNLIKATITTAVASKFFLPYSFVFLLILLQCSKKNLLKIRI